MNIPLHNFEQHIDETILKRGLQYFKKGLVNEPELISHGEYEAIVEGTDDYTVNLIIKNDVVIEYDCTCPYDQGPVCKHVVAVIFYLQQDELKLNEKQPRKPKQANETPKRKTVKEQVDELLGKMSHHELKSYVKELCISNSNFRQLFLAQNAYLVTPDSKELYTNQIKAIIKSAIGREGYLDYHHAGVAGNKVYELVVTAEKMLEKGNLQTAMFMACAVIEEMTVALQYADDSNGDIGGNIEPAVEILIEISNKPLPEDLRNELFNYCMASYRKGIFKGWDWHFSMLDIAVKLIKKDEDARQIHALLDQIKPNDKDWDWDFKEAQRIRLELFKKMDGAEKAIQYIQENLNNSDFRKIAIEKAIAGKDYIRAIALAEDGVKKDDKSLPGLADNWREYLLKIFTLKNDTENIIKYARYIFLYANREKKGYFDILKKKILPMDWNQFVEGLIREIKSNSRWVNYNAIAQIYIWEERWNDLLQIVKQNPSLQAIENYEKHLSKDYTKDIADLYQVAVLKYVKTNADRGSYQNACCYLRRMIKLGARDKANFVINQLRTLYPIGGL